MPNWDLKDLEYWDDAIREQVAEIGLDCYTQEFEVCDHNQMLGFMAYSRHAGPLPALELRQDLREDQDHVRPWGLGSALRDGDQLRSLPRLSDARQLALPADPDDRARLRPQRLLQEQLHLRQGDPGRADARAVQDARRPRARLRGGPLDRARAGRGADRRRPRALDELPAQPGDPQAQRRRSSASARSRPPSRAATRSPGSIAGPSTSSPTCARCRSSRRRTSSCSSATTTATSRPGPRTC